ncbi:MAG TPA: diadenylate cyclase CdaA [Bacteroidales bacterium]|nr:diadenylate cyclase CdaA [Bacteroidales bacterium]HPS16584.1 diadenylate cyclase CdaA [Bacteroidales bacterium]
MTPLFITDFLDIRILDVIDVLLVTILLFQLYKLIKGTGAVNIFIGIIAIYIAWVVVKAFEMKLLSEILGQFISVGVIALIIVFQQEIRQFLLILGSPNFLKKGTKGLRGLRWQMSQMEGLDIEPIVNACETMASSFTGALIVISRRNELKAYVQSGESLNASISKQLIENIFYKNSPLHDGAVIIGGNKIKAARCVLPVSEKSDFPTHLGLRHRAAAGITEESDAIAIVVSEQRGEISVAQNGELTVNIKPAKLRDLLIKEFRLH